MKLRSDKFWNILQDSLNLIIAAVLCAFPCCADGSVSDATAL